MSLIETLTNLFSDAFQRGDRVKKGQIVARLDSRIEAATVALAKARAQSDVEERSAEARLAFQEGEFARTTRLHKRKVIAGRAMEETERELALARLGLREAKLARRLARPAVLRARGLRRVGVLPQPEQVLQRRPRSARPVLERVAGGGRGHAGDRRERTWRVYHLRPRER